MKRYYFVVSYGKISIRPGIINVARGYEKYWSEVVSCCEGENMLRMLERIEGEAKQYGFEVNSIDPKSTKKAAENQAAAWNDGWKKQGKLYDWFKEV